MNDNEDSVLGYKENTNGANYSGFERDICGGCFGMYFGCDFCSGCHGNNNLPYDSEFQ